MLEGVVLPLLSQYGGEKEFSPNLPAFLPPEEPLETLKPLPVAIYRGYL